MQVLTQYKWPGNVRELENVIYRSAVIAQGDTILVKDLPMEIRDAVGPMTSAVPAGAKTAQAQPVAPVATPPVAESVSTPESAPTTAPSLATEAPISSAASPGVAGGTITVEQALDFLHRELSTGEEPILSRLEREMIQRVVRAESGNLLRASEKLGITRSTLRKRVDELGLRV
jgi:two-component system nitrogen regulation response regulator GlnG